MNANQLEKFKKTFVEAGYMEASETMIDGVNTSYVKKSALGIGSWTQGWAYYTDKRLLIPINLGLGAISVLYSDIQAIKKCSQFFMPMGIEITYHNQAENKTDVVKISTSKRQKYIDLLASKSGVNCS